jgi:hypothetical protein
VLCDYREVYRCKVATCVRKEAETESGACVWNQRQAENRNETGNEQYTPTGRIVLLSYLKSLSR